MKNTRSDKGITLVALIITIIVLLILAVVAISAVSGDGILNKAKDAARETKMAQEAEALRIAVNEWKIQSSIPGNEETLAGFLAAKLPEAAVTDDGYGGATVVFPNSMYIVSANGEIIKDTSTSATGGVEVVPGVEVEIGDFRYLCKEDGTAEVLGLSVQGSDKIPDEYGADPVELTMPNEVEYEGEEYTITAIGNAAFFNNANECRNLDLTSLPTGVTTIGWAAFQWCDSLTLTELPSGLTSVGENAFQSCNLSLTELPSGLTNIGIGAFSYCKTLALTSLPSGLTTIPDRAFEGCTNLALTEIPSRITSIGEDAFYGCTNFAFTEIPSRITSIGGGAFGDCDSLTEITFLGKPEYIGGPFGQCSNLKVIKVTWAKGEVANELWGENNAEIIRMLPTGETTSMPYTDAESYKTYAESLGFTVLTTDEYNSETFSYTKIALPYGITGEDSNDKFYDNSTITDVLFPNTIKTIGDYMFNNCPELKYVYVPGSVKKIGFAAFEYCDKLDTIIFEEIFFSRCDIDSLAAFYDTPWFYTNAIEVGDWQYKVIINGEEYFLAEAPFVECFVAGSKVLTLEGLVNIEDVKVGDYVITYNQETRMNEVHKVTETFIHEKVQDQVTISFSDDSKVIMNMYHPLYTEEGWKSLTNFNGYETLKVGDKVKTEEGYKEVSKIEVDLSNSPVDMYTINVEGADNFYVNGTLAHDNEY